jgi:hypothetical protein
MQFGFFATLKELRKWRSPNALSFEHLRKPEIFLIIFRALSQTGASARKSVTWRRAWTSASMSDEL